LENNNSKIFDHFYKHFPNLFKHHIDHHLKRTNNVVERMNLDLEQYPSLKTRMKTACGVNCDVKGMVFLHNYKVFQKYITKIEKKISELDNKIVILPTDEELKSLKHGLIIHLRWVRKYYRNYQEIYNRFFRLSKQVLIFE